MTVFLQAGWAAISQEPLLPHRAEPGRDAPLLNGAFAASSALLFSTRRSPFSQGRNLLGGYVLSALVAGSLAVATASGLMHLTRKLPPPAAGITLSAVIGSAPVHDAGFRLMLVLATVGSLLLAVALAYNNLSRPGRYPEVWF